MGLTKAEKEQRAALERKAREEREAERRAELQQREVIKAEVEALFETHRQKILPNFDNAIIKESADPTGLALLLSKEFQTLQVSVVYENGCSIVKATPKKCIIQTPGFQQTAESIMAQHEPYGGVEGHWPSVAVVKSFAQGFDQATKRAKNKETDREMEDRYHHHPFFRMKRFYHGF